MNIHGLSNSIKSLGTELFVSFYHDLYSFILIGILGVIGFTGPAFAWERQGVYEGTITALYHSRDGNTYHYYAGTWGAGIYHSTDGYNWSAVNSGLNELDITAITSRHGNGVEKYMFAATSSSLYSSSDWGATWTEFTTKITNDPVVTSLAVVTCGGVEYLYAGTFDSGVWRTQWNQQIWSQRTGGSLNSASHILSLASMNGALVAGTVYDSENPSVNPGGLYVSSSCSGGTENWVEKSGLNSTSFYSVVAHSTGDGSYIVLAGTGSSGIYASTDSGTSFSKLCNDNTPPNGPFLTIDFFAGNLNDQFYGVTGTTEQLYCLPDDPRTCGAFQSTETYLSTNFYGAFKSSIVTAQKDREVLCNDSLDNDGDLKADCNDPDCFFDSNCTGETVCNDSIDNDGDGKIDCQDPECVTDSACLTQNTIELCDDSVDNDGDGNVDCDDLDCDASVDCGFNTLFTLTGTKGKGIFDYDVESCMVNQNASYQQIEHKNARQIAISPNISTDHTIFLASASEGMYKSIDSGTEFTRYFCDPNGYGPTRILSIALPNSYDEKGAVSSSGSYTTYRTILLGSFIRGIYYSRDGGASWNKSTFGSGSPLNGMITSLECSPNAGTDKIAFASNWAGRIYRSSNLGLTWTNVSPCLTNAMPQVHELAIDPTFTPSNNEILYLATTQGLVKFDAASGNVCNDCSSWADTSTCSYNVVSVDVRYKSTSPTAKYFLFGTQKNGVWRRCNDNGTWRTWQLSDTKISTSATIVDVAVSPTAYLDSGNGKYYYFLYVVVWDANSGVTRVFYSKDYTTDTQAPPSGLWSGWTELNMTNFPTTATKLFSTVVFHPTFDPAGSGDSLNVYLGHKYQGLFWFQHSTGAVTFSQGSGYYAFPDDGNVTRVDPADENLVLVGTPTMGMFISYDGGQSACPLGRGLYVQKPTTNDLYSVRNVSSIVIAKDQQNVTTLYSDDFSSGSLSNWTVTNNGTGSPWVINSSNPCDGSRTPPSFFSGNYAIVDSNCDGTGKTQYTTLDSPLIDCSDYWGVTLKWDEEFDYLSNAVGEIDIYNSEFMSWMPVYTVYGDSIAQQSQDISDDADGNDQMQVRFYYTASNDNWWMVDNIRVEGYQDRVAVAGTKKNASQTFTGNGLFYLNYTSRESARDGTWSWATSTDSNQVRQSEIGDLTWNDMGQDIVAGVMNGSASVYRSQPGQNYGISWDTADSGLPAGTPLSGVTFQGGMYKGTTLSLWSCSGDGKSPYKALPKVPRKVPQDSDVKALVKSGAYTKGPGDTATWTLSNGFGSHTLSEELFYTAIISPENVILGNQVLIGGWSDTGTGNPPISSFSGIWMSTDLAGSWYPVNQGLDTLNARKISSFLYYTDTFFNSTLLVGVKDPNEGGVFMSDTGGFAWTRVDDFPAGKRSVVNLTVSNKAPFEVYATMETKGIQKDAIVSLIPAGPVPEFLVENDVATMSDKDPRFTSDSDYLDWYRVTLWDSSTFTYFYDVSADQPDIIDWEWDFDYDGVTFNPYSPASGDAYPSYLFPGGGLYTIALRLNNDNSLIQSHKIFVLDMTPPASPDGTNGGSLMQISKGATNDDLVISWDNTTCPAYTSNIIYGTIGQPWSYNLSGSVCDLNTSPYTWDTSAISGDIWFVIVSDNGLDRESSWGKRNDSGVLSDRNGTTPSNQCGCIVKNTTDTCP